MMIYDSPKCTISARNQKKNANAPTRETRFTKVKQWNETEITIKMNQKLIYEFSSSESAHGILTKTIIIKLKKKTFHLSLSAFCYFSNLFLTLSHYGKIVLLLLSIYWIFLNKWNSFFWQLLYAWNGQYCAQSLLYCISIRVFFFVLSETLSSNNFSWELCIHTYVYKFVWMLVWNNNFIYTCNNFLVEKEKNNTHLLTKIYAFTSHFRYIR